MGDGTISEGGSTTSPTVGHLVLTYVDTRRALGQLTGTSPRTVGYRLWMFVDFLGPSQPVAKITRPSIERWLTGMQVAHSTLRVRLSAVKTFCDWLVAHRYLRHNPAALIDRPRQPHLLPPRALTPQQVAAIYQACPDTRAEVIVACMVQEGLRAVGVANLQVGDVDMQRLVLTVHEKGGNERVLPITDECARVLRRYLGETRLAAGPLIRSIPAPHRGIAAESVSRIVGRAMHDAGVDDTGHALRHTCASDMLERGANVRTVQHALGHRSLGSTQRYLRRFVGNLRESMEGRDYR